MLPIAFKEWAVICEALALGRQALILRKGGIAETGGAFRPEHSVAYCPRTHAAFGHPPHPFREFLARGVRVCLATDSLASNPDLDILAEARVVRSRYSRAGFSAHLAVISSNMAGSVAVAIGASQRTPGG